MNAIVDTSQTNETENMSTLMGDNQPDMTPEQAAQAALRFARQCGRDVATGKMGLTTFVSKLLPLARVDRQWIKASQGKELWVENTTAEVNKLSDPFHEPTKEGNSKAANGSKLKQPLALANSVDYAEGLFEDTLTEIGRLRKAGEKTTSPYPAFVDVCRVQLTRKETRLTMEEISAIVCPNPKVGTELSKLEAAQRALKAAQKIREDNGLGPDNSIVRADTLISDRIAVLKQAALVEKARSAAIAAGLTVA